MKAPHADALRKALGRAVRQLRDASDLSQEGFADLVGVHRTYAGSVERGEVNVSLDNLARLAAGLGLPLSALLLAAEDEVERGAAASDAPSETGVGGAAGGRQRGRGDRGAKVSPAEPSAAKPAHRRGRS